MNSISLLEACVSFMFPALLESVIVPALHLFIGVLKLCFLYEYFLFQVLEVADHLERSVDRLKNCHYMVVK